MFHEMITTPPENIVTYPLSTRRYVRLTIPGWTDAADLESVWLSAYKETGATRDRLRP